MGWGYRRRLGEVATSSQVFHLLPMRVTTCEWLSRGPSGYRRRSRRSRRRRGSRCSRSRRRRRSSPIVVVVDRCCRRSSLPSSTSSGCHERGAERAVHFLLVSRAGVRVVKVPATEATGVAGEGKAGAAGQSCRKAFRGVWLRDEGLWSTRVGAHERGTLHTRSGYTHQEARAGLRSVV